MRKYHLYAAVLCSAAVLGLGGCSNKVDAATTLPLVNESRPVVVESEEPTSSAEETTVVETVSGRRAARAGRRLCMPVWTGYPDGRWQIIH